MSTSFGSLGSVQTEIWELPDVEVFAKYQSSVNGNGGPNLADDGGSGPLDPTFAIE